MADNKSNFYPDATEDDEYGPRGMYEETDDMFHVGQCYTETPAKKIRCTTCKNDKLEVGRDEYFTAIRCPNCGWEECIHSG
jgi:predicted RNA-binding Zn-ribbon protein involved in translation (DUF1610 family)